MNITEQKKKRNYAKISQAVTHPSAFLAQNVLTSGIKQVPVLFLWYDRILQMLINLCHIGVTSIGRMDRPIFFIYAIRFKGIEAGF